MCNEVDKMVELDLSIKPLSTLFSKYKGVFINEDPLHLVKCDRYRLACGSNIYIYAQAPLMILIHLR